MNYLSSHATNHGLMSDYPPEQVIIVKMKKGSETLAKV